MKIAVIGDVHGTIDEFKELYELVRPMVDEVWSVGDLVDRGPDSGACIQFCIDNGIKVVMGNHEHTILSVCDNWFNKGYLSKSADKSRTVQSMTREQYEWIKGLPKFHVHEETKTIIVHGGVWPGVEIWQQPMNVIRAQLINPDLPGQSRWWGSETARKYGKTEEELVKEGWHRWYKIYDGEYNVVFGHSVFAQPLLHQNPNSGYCIGVDTGNVFGGMLTAAIIETDKRPYFVSVKMHKVYCPDKLEQFKED